MKVKIAATTLILWLLAGICLAADKPLTDAFITDTVQIKLASDPDVKGGGLRVDVKDGVVTISGSVQQERQKTKATKVARKVKGVKQVINNIVIQEKATGK
jgi:hyperosmotically inducible periplasmic protein